VNIALPALVILLGLLPGITFYYAYFAGRFEKRRVGVSALEEAALYVILAVPINALAFWSFRASGIHLDLSMVGHLLAGTIPESRLQQISSRLADDILLTTASYLMVIAISAIGGMVLRKVVWELRIDTHLEIFRLRHPWYYVFQGRRKGLPRDVLAFVYILVSHAEDKTRLYRGLVADYDMGHDGKLESIILRGAMRGQGRGNNFNWVEIPGDMLVILGSTIHSINVEYWGVDASPDSAALEAAVDPPPADEPPSTEVNPVDTASPDRIAT
jgi:hypothetical protein